MPHRPAGKRLTIAAVAASVLFVGGGAFAGAMVQPYLAERALIATKLEIARTAANAITTLWTYTPDDMDRWPTGRRRFLAGDFANDYRKYIDAIVEPNKQAQVTNTTEVVGAAVEIVSPAGPDRGDRAGLHQFGGDQPGHQEHPVAAVPVLPADDEASRRPSG